MYEVTINGYFKFSRKKNNGLFPQEITRGLDLLHQNLFKNVKKKQHLNYLLDVCPYESKLLNHP